MITIIAMMTSNYIVRFMEAFNFLICIKANILCVYISLEIYLYYNYTLVRYTTRHFKYKLNLITL